MLFYTFCRKTIIFIIMIVIITIYNMYNGNISLINLYLHSSADKT